MASIDLRAELCGDTVAPAAPARPLPARIVALAPGKIDFRLIDLERYSFGIMLLDGLMLAEVDAGRAHAGWLVGAQDLLCPASVHELVLTEQTRWRALAPTRLALLDQQFGLRAGGIPMVTRVLLTRAMRTSSWLFAKSLVVGSPIIEERLLLLFALLGERWGKVTPQGVVLRLPLTHQSLAALCGARRPSVTMSLHALERRGLLSSTVRGQWLLRHGSTPDGRATACLPYYQDSLGLSWSAEAAVR